MKQYLYSLGGITDVQLTGGELMQKMSIIVGAEQDYLGCLLFTMSRLHHPKPWL